MITYDEDCVSIMSMRNLPLGIMIMMISLLLLLDDDDDEDDEEDP